MNHNLKLDDVPYRATQLGKKLLEIRINSEERELIKPGDSITFENRNGTLLTEVVEKRKYQNILELVKNEDFSLTGGIYQSVNDWVENIDSYYTRETQEKRGLLAIQIRIIK